MRKNVLQSQEESEKEKERKKTAMKPRKSMKLTAILLAAVVLSTDVCGGSSLVHAAQQTEQEAVPEEQQAQAEETESQPVSEEPETLRESQPESEEEGRDEIQEEEPEQNPVENVQDSQDMIQKEEMEGSESEDTTEQREMEELPGFPEELLKAAEDGGNEISPEEAFAELLKEYDMYGVLANDAEFPVRQEPSREGAVVQVLTSGYQVRLTGAALTETGLWFQIEFAVNDVVSGGYIESEYVLTQDERLDAWKTQYLNRGMEVHTFTRGSARGTDLSAFPQSYRTLIQKLVQVHPNWSFVPMNTGLEWSVVLKNEMADARNLVETYQPDTWKSTEPKDYNMETGKWVIKNGTNWVQASEAIVKYYLDPRNFLNEEAVFQFEQLTYNASYHTESGVERILSGTFMSHKKLEDGSGDGMTYAQAFIEIGKELKVSPYFLASRVRQEQGVNGTSSLISGTYPGYEGYYNYFNMSATGIGQEVIISGLNEAKNAGWNTRYKALRGGADKVSSKYIRRGQDTFYLQKFDVDASYDGLYWHQYMQNLLAAESEGKSVQKSYAAMGALNNNFVFKVPVYQNMPASPCPKPGENLSKPVLRAEKTGAASIRLSWDEVAAAQGYRIYRSVGTDGSWSSLATVSRGDILTWEDTTAVPGKIYNYRMRAYMKLSGGNKYSPYSDAQTIDCRVPATSWTKFKIKNYRTVELSWKKTAVDGYRIYRKKGTGSYSCIATIQGNSTISYKDTKVVPKNKYTYRIRGYVMVNGKRYYSKYTGTKKADLKMAKPQLKKATVSKGSKIKLTWKRDSKADGYYIYRATSQKGKYTKVATITKNKTVSWSDKNITTGKTYYYKIRSYAKGSSGGTKYSSYSKVSTVKTALSKQTVTSVTVSQGKVKLKWKKDSKATGYKIYRATSKKGKYQEIKKITKNTTVSWTDKTAKAGKNYYYKVRSYANNGKKVKYSACSAQKYVRAK